MKTLVVILRGKNAGRVGTIKGDLANLNPHVTKVWVDFGPDKNPAFHSLDNIRAATVPEKTQGELGL